MNCTACTNPTAELTAIRSVRRSESVNMTGLPQSYHWAAVGLIIPRGHWWRQNWSRSESTSISGSLEVLSIRVTESGLIHGRGIGFASDFSCKLLSQKISKSPSRSRSPAIAFAHLYSHTNSLVPTESYNTHWSRVEHPGPSKTKHNGCKLEPPWTETVQKFKQSPW